MTDAPVLQVRNVTKYYTQKNMIDKNGQRLRRQTVKAVDGVSFDLRKGEILGIIGESGCGKSTLGRLLINLEAPTHGDILINGVSTGVAHERRKAERLAFRKTVQLIFQNPYEVFDPRETMEKILTTPLELHGIGASKAERRQICLQTLEKAGLRPAEDFINRYAHELSGGQLQRVSIMRAMLVNPAFIVADEAVSMLDVSVRADILSFLEERAKEREACMVFISHDIATTRYISDKVAVMYLGRIVEYGKTDEVLHNPIHPYARALISNSASLDPTEKREIINIDGEPPSPIDTGPGCFFAPRCYMCGEKCGKQYPELIDAGGGHFYSCFYANP